MNYNVYKGGIPALAYPHHDSTSPVSLSFIIKCNDRRAQMTLCLQSSLPFEGFDDEQTVILQYDAGNLVPGAISLGPATIPLPQARLDALARAGNAQIRTLSIKLKRACPVWCHPSVSLKPRSSCDARFTQLSSLAQATQINVVFDYNWLHRGLHAAFLRLVEHPDELGNFPVGQRYREQRLRQVDWTVFSTACADVGADAAAEIEEGELPPVYAEASSKRPRQGEYLVHQIGDD
ncbi:hypothetical protein OPT61_g1228 [Boeremia exigua]|uniref:Uncharacterized protein n=1 Tax=Boeremia exigua TaxID=749465 RepID=A0ACC2IR41_9PLEO|nr:hypothetical protein OPT61_g1228 [Boeremia exigua]